MPCPSFCKELEIQNEIRDAWQVPIRDPKQAKNEASLFLYEARNILFALDKLGYFDVKCV